MAFKLFEDGSQIPTEPNDADRFALAQESEVGARWFTWGNFKVWLNTVAGNVFDWVDFTPQSTVPTYEEGRTFYDADKNALSYYNENTGVIVNLGQEVLFPVTNNSGTLITNGSIVTPDATGIVLADRKEKNKSRLIAVATSDIANGGTGYVTRLGQVGGLDTSSYSAGQILYLGNSGQFTTTIPTDGEYENIVGVVDVVNATEGIITVDINVSQLTVEVTDTNGFPPDQRTATEIVPLVGSLLMSLLPKAPAAEFHYYERGDKYESTGDAVSWTDLEGEHWFFYEEGIFTHEYNPSAARKEHIILNHAFVSSIYWDAINKEIITDVQDERHGISMSPYTHLYLHLTRGAQWVSGYSLGNFDADGDGDLDSSAQFSISEGLFFDEDLSHNETGLATGSTIPILYNLGANGNIRQDTNPGFIVLTGANGRAVYNEWTGTEWILSEIPDRDAVCYHIFGFNGQTVKTVAVVGQSEYGNVNAARDGAATEISNLISQLPFAEMIPVGTIVFETRNSYDNAVKSRVRTIDGADYIPWTDTELSQGSAPSSHANLTNVDVAGVGITQGHVDETLYSKILSADYHRLDLEDDFLNLTDVTNNAYWSSTQSSFKLPYDCNILEMIVIPFGVDSGTKGNLNIKIKGNTLNVFTSALSIASAGATDGSGGQSTTSVTADNGGLKGAEVLFFNTAGTTGDAIGGMLYLLLERV